MKQWFKSIWLRMRKSNGLPGNEVLVPMTIEKQPVTTETSTPVVKPKRIVVRKKKDTTNVN